MGARIQQPPFDILDRWLREGALIEYEANAASIMPIEDIVWLKGIQSRMRQALQPELDRQGVVVAQVLDRLSREGPLPARAFISQEHVAGYWDSAVAATKATSHALNLLRDVGMIRVVARDGGHRLFDLMERGLNSTLLASWQSISLEEADRGLLDKYIRAYGIVDAGDPRFGWRRQSAATRNQQVTDLVNAERLTPLSIENVSRSYYIETESLERLEKFRGMPEVDPEEAAIRFLPPLDNLLWRRERIQDIFDFSYRWEIYIPDAKRQYGPYVMPILAGSRLIGRLNARCLRRQETLEVLGIWWEPETHVSPILSRRIMEALQKFASQLGMRTLDISHALAGKV